MSKKKFSICQLFKLLALFPRLDSLQIFEMQWKACNHLLTTPHHSSPAAPRSLKHLWLSNIYFPARVTSTKNNSGRPRHRYVPFNDVLTVRSIFVVQNK